MGLLERGLTVEDMEVNLSADLYMGEGTFNADAACVICLKAAWRITLCSACGNGFCKACLQPKLAQNGNKCPACGDMYS